MLVVEKISQFGTALCLRFPVPEMYHTCPSFLKPRYQKNKLFKELLYCGLCPLFEILLEMPKVHLYLFCTTVN